MKRIQLFLMRHSTSCSNHVREDIAISQGIRDPALSVEGQRLAERYRPHLQKKLKGAGFDVETAIIASSTLRRAKQTAEIVFGKNPVALPCFTENGAIPENTPVAHTYAPPCWKRFSDHIAELIAQEAKTEIAVVGHGSYLLSLWPKLTGAARDSRLNNLDGILLDVDVRGRSLHILSHKEIRCPFHVSTKKDRCSVGDTRKIAALRRGMTRKGQSGGNGSAGMNQAFFQDGAQMPGRFSEPTGVGLAGTTNSWIRTPLTQTGGARRTRRNRAPQEGGIGSRARRGRHSRRVYSQNGGFSASVMGAFAANGARLLPVAAYMGYKMYSNSTKKTKKRVRGSRRR
jgi:broad specificity phosphatase PhoE